MGYNEAMTILDTSKDETVGLIMTPLRLRNAISGSDNAGNGGGDPTA